MLNLMKFEIVKTFMNIVKTLGIKGYLVGGAVRDIIMDRTPIDFDFSVELSEENHKKISYEIAKTLDIEYEYNNYYHTSKFFYKGFDIDFVMARSEYYPEIASKPIIKSSNIFEDLIRRDFTINAMAIPLYNDCIKLIDPFNGEEDIKKGKLRALNPMSFRDDPTRIFRGIKYASRFQMEFDEKTKFLIDSAVKNEYILSLKSGRIRQELNLLLRDENPLATILFLEELNIFNMLAGEKISLSLDIDKDEFKILKDDKRFALLLYKNDLEILNKLKSVIGLGKSFIRYSEEIRKNKMLKGENYYVEL